MAVKLISPPATLALTVVEAKKHLRIETSDQDSEVQAYTMAAIANVENWLGRALIDQTWELYLDKFPTGSDLEIEIPKPPLIEVLQVAYDDSNGDEQIIASGSYYVDTVTQPGWVIPQGSLLWPTPIDAINSVRVRFRAGYLSTDSPPVAAVPEDIKAAIKLTLGNLWEYRETQVVGIMASKLPFGVEQLLRQHRVLLGMA